MKKLLFLTILLASSLGSAQDKRENNTTKIVEASCGQCQFGMTGHGCDLAVRIDGKSYFVDGSSIDSHGDAHAKDGFCSAIRKASVKGEVVNNRFKATSFVLLPKEKKKS